MLGDAAGQGLSLHGRYTRPLALPDPETSPEAVTSTLIRLAANRGGSSSGCRVAAFACGDEWLAYLDHERDLLWSAGIRFSLPASPVLRDLLDKQATYRRAAAAGCPYPETFGLVPKGDGPLRQMAESLPYPVLLKPVHSREFSLKTHVKVVRCDDPAQWMAAAKTFSQSGPLLVQRFIPGGDDALLTVGVYRTLAGEVAGVFTGHKLRQHPEGAGVCSLGETLPAADMAQAVDYALALLADVSFHGIAQVEFKRDAVSNLPYLMEVNPRTWSWHALATYSGVDLPWLAYCDLIGDPIPPAVQTRAGFWWYGALDVRTALPRIRKGRLGLADWLHTLPPLRGGAGVYALWALDDPLPSLHYVWDQVARKVTRPSDRRPRRRTGLPDRTVPERQGRAMGKK